MEVNVNHDENNQIFLAEDEGKTARLQYTLRGENTIDFLSTYVPPPIRNRGIAAKIVKTGLEYAKKNNLKVIPTCSYVESFIDKNEEYKDLLQE